MELLTPFSGKAPEATNTNCHWMPLLKSTDAFYNGPTDAMVSNLPAPFGLFFRYIAAASHAPAKAQHQAFS